MPNNNIVDFSKLTEICFKVVTKDADMLSANSNRGIANLTFDADLNKACQQSKNLKL